MLAQNGVKALNMSIFLGCVWMCKHLIEVVLFKVIPNKLCGKSLVVIIAYFNFKFVFQTILWLQMMDNYIVPKSLYVHFFDGVLRDAMQNNACKSIDKRERIGVFFHRFYPSHLYVHFQQMQGRFGQNLSVLGIDSLGSWTLFL